MKKSVKKNVIQVSKFIEKEEEDMTRLKQNHFEVHHLIVIQGKINKCFVKQQTNKVNNLKY